MSNPNPKTELHEAVEEFIKEIIGSKKDADNLHQQIDHAKKTEIYYQFLNWINEKQ